VQKQTGAKTNGAFALVLASSDAGKEPSSPDPLAPDQVERVGMHPVLDGRCWRGTTKAFGTFFCAELAESKRHAGYYYYAASCVADSVGQKLMDPVKAESLAQCLEFLLQDHGLGVADMKWAEVPRGELGLLRDVLSADAQAPEWRKEKMNG
jgi:hypothetical protein